MHGGEITDGEYRDKLREGLEAVWDRDDFCQLARERLDAKFGKPTIALKDKAITGAGVEVSQTRTMWTRKDSTATFTDPFSKVDNCWLIVNTPIWDKAHPKEKAEF